MGVLIVCPVSVQQRVTKTLARLTALNWAQDGAITLLAVPERKRKDASYITGLIRTHLRSDSALSHILTLDVEIKAKPIEKRAYLRTTHSIRSFELRELPQVLEALGLDWLSRIDQILRNGWHNGDIDRSYLVSWIDQFEKMRGSYGWVAEGLLRILEFWSDSRIRKALRIDAPGLSGFDCVVVNRHRFAGKSADAIGGLVKKQLDVGRYEGINPEVMGIRDALSISELKNILYVEDCLITGNEMVRVFTALLGREDRYGKSKADPLDDPTLLRQKRITLRFAVATNGGQAFVRKFLETEGLNNIVFDPHTEPLSTVTPIGLACIQDNSLSEEDYYIPDIESRIIRSCFQSLEIWGDNSKAQRAMEFCATVGRQLYKLYLEKRGKPMTHRTLDQAALGISGLALALAFSHSIPKETLPLFWMCGTIRWEGKDVEWNPLFRAGE